MNCWKMKWPKDGDNEEFRNYWKDKALKTDYFGIEILEKKLKSSNELDYTWEHFESLMWDEESESFKS